MPTLGVVKPSQGSKWTKHKGEVASVGMAQGYRAGPAVKRYGRGNAVLEVVDEPAPVVSMAEELPQDASHMLVQLRRVGCQGACPQRQSTLAAMGHKKHLLDWKPAMR